MAASGRWPYVVFMCQQAIEKLVKGLYILYVDDNVPRLHNINTLIRKFEAKLPKAVTEEYRELFEDLTVYYLNARYTEYKQNLSARMDEKTAGRFLKRTKEAFAWLLTLKP